VDFDYTVNAKPVADSTVALFWSTDGTFAHHLGGPLYSKPVPANTQPKDYAGHASADALGTPPPGAQYLIEVTDPGNVLGYFSESGNVVAYALADDIEMDSVTFAPRDNAYVPQSLEFQYAISGRDLLQPLVVQAYRSPTADFDPATAVRLGDPV